MPCRAFSTPVLLHREGERERKRAGCPTRNGYKGSCPLIAMEPRCRLRDAETPTIQHLPVQGCGSPVSRSGGLYGDLKRFHPIPYPFPPGPCLRTLGEDLGTLWRYTASGLYAGVRSHPSGVPGQCSTTDRASNYCLQVPALQLAGRKSNNLPLRLNPVLL